MSDSEHAPMSEDEAAYFTLGGFFIVNGYQDWKTLSPDKKETFWRILHRPHQVAPYTPSPPVNDLAVKAAEYWLAPIAVWETLFLVIAGLIAARFIQG